MPQISVVVPTRDVREYVGAVLDDLRAQTFADFEALVVDDGSTDGTPDVIARLAAQDRRFQQLSSGGAGASAARNLGVDRATGEFLAFVDGDDRLSPDYLRTLHESAVATGSDLVSANAHRLDGFRTSPSYLHQRACARPRLRTHLSRAPQQLVWDTTVWNKLWRRSMWDRAGIRYDEGRWINDLLPCIQGHVAARQVDVLGEVLYYWRVRTDPTTSITDRRLTDISARAKSFEDRMHAIRQARGLLAEHLPRPAVLDAFDFRVLHNDLPIYLPYYRDADDGHQQAILTLVRDLLERFQIRPERFPVGMMLQAAYHAILAGDRDRLAAVLDDRTRVAASSTRPQRTELLLPEAPAGRSAAHGLVPWLLRQLRPGRNGSGRVTAAAQVDRIEVDTPTPGQLTLHGVVRIREGRSDVAGQWTAAARLDGTPRLLRARGLRRLRDRALRLLRVLSATTRVVGGRAPVAAPPDEAIHPLVRSGWRPFTATIDVTLLQRHPRIQDWTLGLELQAGRFTCFARTTLARQVLQSLPSRLGRSTGVDLVPVTDRSRRLHLHQRPVLLRLEEAVTTPAGPVLPFPSVTGGCQVWLQTQGGDLRTPEAAAGAETSLPLPDQPGQYELWCRTPRGTGRVRAGDRLGTTSVRVDGGTETVLHPTRHGDVVVTVRAAELDLRWVETGEAAAELVLGGSGDPVQAGANWLELACRWTGDRIPVTVERAPAGWRAAVPAATLTAAPTDRNRNWTVEVRDHHGRATPVRVPAELHRHLPWEATVGTDAVYLFLDEWFVPTLSLTPDNDGQWWPKLRRIQRSTAAAARPR